MMDNAIRACRLEEKGSRELHLSIISQRGYGMICVKNKIAESVLEKNPSLSSSKESSPFPGELDADGMESHGMHISPNSGRLSQSLAERTAGDYSFYRIGEMEFLWFILGKLENIFCQRWIFLSRRGWQWE